MALKNLTPITKKGKDNIKDTQEAMEDTFGHRPTDRKIWKSIQDPGIRRNIQDFQWKLMHNRLRVGAYWKNIPGFEERVSCTQCGAEETMDHILFACPVPGRERLWKMAEELWERSNTEKEKEKVPWIVPSTALLRGIGSAKKDATTSKYKMILTETAWILWKARNERTIGEKEIEAITLRTRWVTEINKRIESKYVQALKCEEKEKRK